MITQRSSLLNRLELQRQQFGAADELYAAVPEQAGIASPVSSWSQTRATRLEAPFPCVSMGPAVCSHRNQMGDGSTSTVPDILRGTLDLLVLKALSWGPSHGYGVARRIEAATNDVLVVGEGTLYPALHRLEERGWVTANWGTSENNRQAKFYSLTTAGRAQLRVETANWRRYAAAVFDALDASPVK